jgi:two-component system LytT family response regulator
MLSAVIIEDMPEAVEILKRDLSYYCPELTIIGTAGSVVEGAKLLKQKTPDILFLDVSLGDGTGFDLLEIIQDVNMHIIFITASEEYALRAFRYSATDYLLKPIDPDLLSKAVNKVRSLKKPDKPVIDLLKETAKNPLVLPSKISLHTLDKIIVVSISSIIRCESEGNNTWFFLSGLDKIFVTRTLKYYEEILLPHDFIRVHQSHLISLDYVCEFLKKDGGYLLMKNGDMIPVSSRKRQEVLAILDSRFYN